MSGHTGEKISEDSVNGIFEYNVDKRNQLELRGGLTCRVFSKNTVDITYKEDGRRRPSSTILKLVINSRDNMSGTLLSKIAASKGRVTFARVKE